MTQDFPVYFALKTKQKNAIDHSKRTPWSILRKNALQILVYILGTILNGLIWLPLGVTT